jgi:hypothetical protein
MYPVDAARRGWNLRECTDGFFFGVQEWQYTTCNSASRQ